MYQIIKFLSENLYITIVIGVLIAMVIFFIVGKKKQTEKEQVEQEQLENSKINAPKTKKKFVQGQKIEEQDLSINHNKNED